MGDRSNTTVIITDEQAEGALKNGELREPNDPEHTLTSPRPHAGGARPSAETGMMPAVMLSMEGADKNDVQDSARTTAETQRTSAAQPARDFNGSPSVLIIEDTMELAEVISATLQRVNMRTAHESHGMRALARFNQMNPDIVLLDIGLPDIKGWELLERIKERQVESGGAMPIVIVITAYGDPANRLVAKLHGVHDYLIKPFTPDEVEQTVKRALSGSADEV